MGSPFMLRVDFAFLGAGIAIFLIGLLSMLRQPEDNQDGFAGSPLLTEVAPLGSIATVPGSPLNLEQSLTSQLDRVPVTQNEVFMTVRWRAPAEFTNPEDSTEVAVLRVLMRRLSQLQESPAASDTKARALFKLMEAEQVLLGSELRGDMPSFPGIK
jgi:hypothetical protein